MVYLDFCSLCLTIAMRRVDRRLFPYSLRFTLTEPHRTCCAWARGWPGTWSHTAIDLSSVSLIGAMRPGGTRAEGGGEGAQVGRGGEV